MPSLNQMAVLLVAVMILIVGLANPGGISDHGAKEKLLQQRMVRSEKERVTTPDVNEAELAELVASTSAFAFDLYQAIRESDSNLFCSPYSISLALAMTYAGAREVTQQQMADTLHFAFPQARLHPAFNALDLELASRSEGPEHQGEEGFKLNIANSIWGQSGYSFLADFLDILAENYGAGLRILDFSNAPEDSRITINDWVSDETKGKIEDLLFPGSITSDTRLVLTNAIYFNAAWLSPFEIKLTHDGTFYLPDGGQVTVPMMEQEDHLRYEKGEGYQAVELPYSGRELAMIVLLPDAGSFTEFEGSLDADRFASLAANLAPETVHLTMPKFVTESTLSLKETLSEMGMQDAFLLEVANFSGMDGSRLLFIGDVIHRAFVSVDEAGTEAAAATAITMVGTALEEPPPPAEMRIDRPFIFAIRDIKTGAILFVGRVLNPGAG